VPNGNNLQLPIPGSAPVKGAADTENIMDKDQYAK